MNNDCSENVAPLDEQLVAYLDGELDAEGRRRIEELLAADAEIRRRLQEMERTWNLLDDLDTTPVGEKFTGSTLEMVALAAGEDAERLLAEAPRRRRRRRLKVGGGLLAAALAGFLATMLFWPDPNRQLVQDLSVLENLDRYRPVEDLAFLHLLRDQGLFLVPPDDRETLNEAAPPADESPARRRERIANMSPGEKQRLARLQERFEALDPEQQQRLRRLDASLQTDPDASELRGIMERYGEWLQTLPSFTRAELVEQKPIDRIDSVTKRLREEQRRDGGMRLGSEDAKKLMQWINGLAARCEKQLLDALPPPQRKRFAESTPPMRQRMLVWQILQQWQAAGHGRPPPMIGDDDLSRLRTELSPKMRKQMESKPAGEQWQLAADWMRRLARQRLTHGRLPEADDQRLADFFENELSDEQRDRLLAMPGEEMQQTLQRMYMTRMKPPAAAGHRYHHQPPPADARERK